MGFRQIFTMLLYLKRLYQKLPLSPSLRFKLGQLKRRATHRARLSVVTFEAKADGSISGKEMAIPPGLGGARDYFVFGVIDWHFRHQRPQQLAQAICNAGHRVFYVSVNFVNHKEPGFSLERLGDTHGLYQICLHLEWHLSIYSQVPSAKQLAQLKGSLRCLMDAARTVYAVNIINHPFWFPLAAFVPGAVSVYDCMDFHAGFSNTAQAYDGVELEMLRSVDLTVVTSSYLFDYAQGKARRVELIRNAGDFSHFHQAAAVGRPKACGLRPVIGYYGAIAEWFDAELLARVAKEFGHCDIRLIGDDTAGVGLALREFDNVSMLGERAYAELPRWLAEFDVCLIPFRITQLTLATNPVKVYEYLSAGKAVVATNLPELLQFGDLVYTADSAESFLESIRCALKEGSDAGADVLMQRRVEFVRGQTWAERAARLVQVAEFSGADPLVSVVVVSYNQWHLTQRCLKSIASCNDSKQVEVIVVDNASGDATPHELQKWAAGDAACRAIVLNAENRGFGAAVNQGLAMAKGAFLVVMNNDTVVSPGWLRGLRRHFEMAKGLGIICPITNNIGNEAQVRLRGTTVAEVFAAARHYSMGKTGELLPLDNVAFFCVMLTRAVYEKIGELDEQFSPGFFEDDDYCNRVRRAGWAAGCAEDVFVYHELSASFDKEEPAHRKAIFERNKHLYEAKWGPWKPHTYRPESTHIYPNTSPLL